MALTLTPTLTLSPIPWRSYTTPGKKQQAAFALDVARRALSWLEDFFGVEYPHPNPEPNPRPKPNAKPNPNPNPNPAPSRWSTRCPSLTCSRCPTSPSAPPWRAGTPNPHPTPHPPPHPHPHPNPSPSPIPNPNPRRHGELGPRHLSHNVTWLSPLPGAMENWGLVTFREAALLVDEGQSTPAQLTHVAYI